MIHLNMRPSAEALSRRKFLQVGYSGLVGLGLPGLLAGERPRREQSGRRVALVL